MKYSRRLRTRIIVAFLVFGLVLSAMLTAGIVLTRSIVEDRFVGQQLMEQLEKDIEGARQLSGEQDQEALSMFSSIQGFLVKAGRLRNIPDYMHDLDDGVHLIRTDMGQFLIAVKKEGDIWGYLQYDVSWNETIDNIFIGSLVLVFVLVLIMAVLLAIGSSRRIMAPVVDLAYRINALGRDETSVEALRPWYADDEVGQLAAALDDYAERLTLLVEQDKEFNADVSHELRTPLAVISSATELMLAQDDLTDRTRLRLQRIERAVRQSTELTTALLHLVRQQKEDEADESHDVVKVIENVIDGFTMHLTRKPLELEIIEKDVFSVRASNAVLSVALGNLIGNAIKYTPRGKVSIRIEQPCVIVEDTGPGLEGDELVRVFDRHYRGSSSSGSSSGIGLSIVRRLCDLYGWAVKLENITTGGMRAIINFCETAE
ncbi:MAG: sensor histidine kinase [bacterium]